MAKSFARTVSPVVGEFDGIRTGDKRLDRRVAAIASTLAMDPAASFPSLFVTDAEREAFYRLLRNERVTLEKLLAPHAEATRQRGMAWPLVVVAHDTTEVAFKGTGRSELYELRKGTYGFAAHVSFALGFADRPHPLGTLAATIHADATSNRGRWMTQALSVQQEFAKDAAVVHVMDREADVFSLFAGLIDAGARFVIRARHDRLLAADRDQERSLLEHLERRTEVRAHREVLISERLPTAKATMPDERKARPPRKSRLAQLAIRACSVTLPRPQRSGAGAKNITLNIVHVREVEAPVGIDPIEWLLATTESIDREADLLRVIDIYRSRWTIEELFKALKTGCAYEARQLEQLGTLKVALALFLPIAWQLLLIRSCSRHDDIPAAVVITPARHKILTALCAQNRHPIHSDATARDILLAIARLGGHIRQNGDPGWQVLWRGYKQVIDAEQVLIATRHLKM